MISKDYELSDREQEILRLVATGASNKQIAFQLAISTNTVKVHLRNIFGKIGVTSRTEATLFAIREGLVLAPGGGPMQPQPEGEPGPLAEAKELNLELASADTVEAALHPLKNKPVVWLHYLPAILVLLLVGLLGVSIQHFLLSGTTTTPQPTPVQWETKAAMPSPRSGLAIALYNEQVYAIGGEGPGGVTGEVARYSPVEDQWKALKAMPLAVSEISAGVIDGRIYIPGGKTSSGQPTDGLEIYDPRTDQWQAGPRLPIQVSGYALTVVDGKIYLFGGWDGKRYLNSAYQFDPGSQQWTQMTPMLTARAYAGAATTGGKIYVLGGYDGKNVLKVNEVYSPELEVAGNHPWQSRSALPDGRYGMGVSVLADSIFIFCGRDQSGADINRSLQYNPFNDSWSYLSAPAQPIGFEGGEVAINANIYWFGGQIKNEFQNTSKAFRAVYSVFIPLAGN